MSSGTVLCRGRERKENHQGEESWLGYPGSGWEIFQFNLILFNVYTGARAGLALMVFMFECLAYSEYEVKLSPLMTNGGR